MAKRLGRPAGGDGSNRDHILNAARRQFAERGYAGTTIRSIADEAGFDLALVSHYFGKKEDLLAASLQLPARAATLIPEAFNAPRAEHGERLTRAYLSLWEEQDTGVQMRALARTSLGSEQVSNIIIEMITALTASFPSGEFLEGRETNFKLAMSHLLGAAITRYVLGVPGLADLDFSEFVERIAPAVQLQLTRDKGN